MDREKIINGLEHCKIGDCVGCPYDQIREESLHGKHYKWKLVCNEQLTEDIIALLKEQEPKQIVCKPGKRTNLDGSVDYFSEWYCPHCGRLLNRGFDTPWVKFCYRCGKPVTWDD